MQEVSHLWLDNGRYEYYDKNFNLQFSSSWEINGNEILYLTSFWDGITLVATSSEYGYPNYNYDNVASIDTLGNLGEPIPRGRYAYDEFGIC